MLRLTFLTTAFYLLSDPPFSIRFYSVFRYLVFYSLSCIQILAPRPSEWPSYPSIPSCHESIALAPSDEHCSHPLGFRSSPGTRHYNWSPPRGGYLWIRSKSRPALGACLAHFTQPSLKSSPRVVRRQDPRTKNYRTLRPPRTRCGSEVEFSLSALLLAAC